MSLQTVFERHEMKFLLSMQQKDAILAAMRPYMELDCYGRTTIRNLYFDTKDYLLVRRSIEKPIYKEKLRIRSYQQASEGSPVFVELKKKYRSVVYKRRVVMSEEDAMAWTLDHKPPTHGQIAEEIEYLFKRHPSLHPVVFLSYAREAYYVRDGSDFRVTFDDTILCRQHDLSLKSAAYGTPILPEDKVLMELKCSCGIPLWMTQALSSRHIYKTSFSKYGTAYQHLIFPEHHHHTLDKEGSLHA